MVDQSEAVELDAQRRREHPKCGAKAKQTGRPCQAPAMSNGRCKLHGGLSRGARSLHGKIRVLSGLWQYEDCRKELRALANAFEKGRGVQTSIDRLVANKSRYVESALGRILKWTKSDIAVGMGH